MDDQVKQTFETNLIVLMEKINQKLTNKANLKVSEAYDQFLNPPSTTKTTTASDSSALV